MSDFNHIWLDKPYNELTDAQLKAVADWHQGWGNKDQHRACVHMMALRTQIAAERERADRAEAESEAVRALLRWPGDFCLSCGGDGGHEEACRGTTGLLALQAQRDELRERVARLEALILHETGQDKDGLMPHEPREALLILRRTALEGK